MQKFKKETFMAGYTPYESIYSLEKLHNPFTPLVKEDLLPMRPIEKTWMAMEGTMISAAAMAMA